MKQQRWLRAIRSVSISTAACAAVVVLCVAQGVLRAQDAPEAARDATDVRSVRAFGAKGDGKTDDTAAIQAAIDDLPEAGGAVRVPSGTYLVNRLVLRSGTTFLGSGQATVLEALPEAMCVITFAEGEQTGIRIADMVIDGGYAEDRKDQGIGLFATKPSVVVDLSVERVRFRNHQNNAIQIGRGPGEKHHDLLFRDIDIRKTGLDYGSGFLFHSGSNIWIDRTVIMNVGGKRNDGRSHGIWTKYKSEITNFRVTNCHIEGSGSCNIFLGDTHDVRIVNNSIRAATRGGGTASGIQANCAYAGRMRGLLISGNEIVDSGGYGLCVSNVDEVQIIGNKFLRGTDPAIRMQGDPKNWIIANNMFLDVESVGPVVIGETKGHSHYGVISGNVFSGCKMWALSVSGGQHVSIVGNTICDNGQGWGRDEDGTILDPAGKPLDLRTRQEII